MISMYYEFDISLIQSMQCIVKNYFYELATSSSNSFLINQNHENYMISNNKNWAVLFYVFVTMDNLFIFEVSKHTRSSSSC